MVFLSIQKSCITSFKQYQYFHLDFGNLKMQLVVKNLLDSPNLSIINIKICLTSVFKQCSTDTLPNYYTIKSLFVNNHWLVKLVFSKSNPFYILFASMEKILLKMKKKVNAFWPFVGIAPSLLFGTEIFDFLLQNQWKVTISWKYHISSAIWLFLNKCPTLFAVKKVANK